MGREKADKGMPAGPADELRDENRRLADQVKRLVRLESQLHSAQEKSEAECLLYRKLYEAGRQLGSTLEEARILEIAAHFAVYEVGVERCLVLLHAPDETVFRTRKHEGYFEEDDAQVAAAAALELELPALEPLAGRAAPVVCAADDADAGLAGLGLTCAMDEFVVLPLGDEAGVPLGLLVAGNRAGRAEFHTRIQPDSPEQVALASFAVQTGTALRNVRLYQELEREKRELEKLAKLQQAILDNASYAIISTRTDGVIRSFNRAAEQMLGYSEAEVVGKATAEILHDRTEVSQRAAEFGFELGTTIRPGFDVFVAKTLRNLPNEHEWTYVRKNGTRLQVQLSVTALRDADGEITGFLGIANDITRRKKAEAELIRYQQRLEELVQERTAELEKQKEALRLSEEQYRSLVENLNIGIYRNTGGPHGRFLQANPAIVRMFGYASTEEFMQVPVANLYVDHADRARFVKEVQRDGHARNRLLALRRKDGTPFVGSCTATPHYNSEGEIEWMDGVMEDATERHAAAEEIQRAKDAAESANRAKSAFLAMMSHEIRTPMNAVIGMSGLLLDGQLTAEQRDFARTIRNSGEALLTIINDILDFSKIEAGKLELESVSFDVRAWVESALELMGHRAREKGLELGCLFEAQTPAAVQGDSTRLNQVLLNLVGNAIKFTERGEVIVRVSARPLDAGAAEAEAPAKDGWFELHFSVRDTGIGIPPEKQDHLFQAFSQADTSTSRKYGGTGLGLAISKRLVEMMDGRIWVESEPGKGSTFHFTIRLRGVSGALPVYLAREQPGLSGRRVLVVDDNGANREIVSRQISSWGMSPVVANSGAEALDLLRRGERIDALVTDLMMPEMDGMELCRQVQDLPGGPDLPLVLMSSAETALEPDCRGHFKAVLLKPVRASRLYDSLVEIFHPGQAIRIESPEAVGFDRDMGRRHPLHILLAEDNQTNQVLAREVLGRLGYGVDVAANGLEALDAVKRRRYDLVLMDVQMPEMDGLAATREIRKSLAPADQPRIAALTADAMEEDRRKCLAAGMDDYLSKPLLLPELVGALQRCRAGGTSPPAAAAPPPPVTAYGGDRRSGPPVLDPAVLNKLKATLGPRADEVLPVLLGQFFGDGPTLLADQRLAIAEDRAGDLCRAAHTLKSNAATFGAMALNAVEKDLERLAKAGTVSGAEPLLLRGEQEFARAKAAIEEWPGISRP